MPASFWERRHMSPEQAKGRTVDKRTDIFAFGCVLYEMLTSKQTFEGEDVADILSRVLQREPDWSALPSSTPMPIRELLRLCLEKDAKKRRRDIGDVRIDLERAFKEPAATEHQPASRLPWVIAAVLAFAVASTMGALYFRAPVEAPEMRTDIVTPATSDSVSFAVSPDGRKIVFAASADGPTRLWLRPLDSAS